MATQLCLTLTLCLMAARRTSGDSMDEARIDSLEATVAGLHDVLEQVGRQLMQQQFQTEEKARTAGWSGVKAVRGGRRQGSRPYLTASYAEEGVAGVHHHADRVDILGMAEVVAVLNGVEFRTRHNDFRFRQKSATSGEYGATQAIPAPPVPPEVTSLGSVEEQVEEMKEWFRAWAEQNHTVRDYRPYFKPVLCYLEGAWMHADGQDQVRGDASESANPPSPDTPTWEEMMQKVRFGSISGHKDDDEGDAYLPSTVMDVDESGNPVMAQWDYRLLCHQLRNDLPRNRIRVVNDIKSRMYANAQYGGHVSLDDFQLLRQARFQVNVRDSGLWEADAETASSLLDTLMGEIPGANNYGAKLVDDAYGAISRDFHKKTLNVAYYNRLYRSDVAGVSGSQHRTRSFQDPYLYMALTNQTEVAAMTTRRCDDGGDCRTWTQRWTWAVPMEIIYTNPLSNWNPLDIEYKGQADSEAGRTVTEGPGGVPRTGDPGVNTAYDGANSRVFYRTPADFFGGEYDCSPADATGSATKRVLNRQGEEHAVHASGYRVVLPEIPGVGVLRQRHPITPIYDEGSAVWKELAALTDVTLKYSRYGNFRGEVLTTVSGDEFTALDTTLEVSTETTPTPIVYYRKYVQDKLSASLDAQMASGIFRDVMFQMQKSDAEFNNHVHDFNATADQMADMHNEADVRFVTTMAEGHQHTLEVRLTRDRKDDGSVQVRFLRMTCDGLSRCADGHARRVNILTDPSGIGSIEPL